MAHSDELSSHTEEHSVTSHSLQGRTLPKSPSSKEPAGHHKLVMQRFTVRCSKNTTGIPSQTHSSSPGNQALCTSQENLQNHIADTLCCLERELQMLLFAPVEYQKGNTARAPVRSRYIPWQVSSRGATWIHSQGGKDRKVQA